MNCYIIITIWCLSHLAHCIILCGNSVIKVKSVHQAAFAKAKAWPWQISLQNKKGSHFCGGTVVGDRWILTAASCRTNASEMVIKLGTLDLKSGRTYLIKEVHYHPQYDEKTKDNNVALIEALAQRIKYSDEVQPICLPNKDKSLEREQVKLVLTGWGDTMDLHNVEPNKLIQVGTRTFDFDKCSIEYRGLNKKTQFCATAEGKDTKDTCQADYGSPLVKEVAGRWFQFGIVTMGKSEQNPCENKEKAAVYTRVAKYINWIEQTMREGGSTTRNPGLETPEYTKPQPAATGFTNNQCGKPTYAPIGNLNRVIGGQISKPNSWPWQISLQFTDGMHICGGTIISYQWILTAAHCTAATIYNPSSTIIKVGAHDLTNSGEDFAVEKAINHPQYHYETKINDIALIKLKQPLSYGDKVIPVCLPLKDQTELEQGKVKMTVTGWGDTISGGGVYPTQLMQVSIKILDFTTCGRRVDTRIQFCAGNAGKDSCQGDSGGPLVMKRLYKYYQYGVVSYGGDEDKACDNKDKPGIYTRVASYCNWIEETVGQQLCR